MDSHTKVMTVSYGIFSCTLEGFDDPFTTMQLVAEYFRKLSKEDRHFGGEPLQADSTKMQKLAQRVNTSRIITKVSNNSILLRQADVIEGQSQPGRAKAGNSLPSPLKDQMKQDAESEEKKEPTDYDDLITPFSSRRRFEVKDFIYIDEDFKDSLDNVDSSAIEDGEDYIKETTQTANPDVTQPNQLDTAVSSIKNTPDEPANDRATRSDEPVQASKDTAPEGSSPVDEASDALKAIETGESIDRWLDTANEKMASQEHTTKTNAVERLKAAVAATEANRKTQPDDGEDNEKDAADPDADTDPDDVSLDTSLPLRRELAKKVSKTNKNEPSVFKRPTPRHKTGNDRPRPAQDDTSGVFVLDAKQRVNGRNK